MFIQANKLLYRLDILTVFVLCGRSFMKRVTKFYNSLISASCVQWMKSKTVFGSSMVTELPDWKLLFIRTIPRKRKPNQNIRKRKNRFHFYDRVDVSLEKDQRLAHHFHLTLILNYLMLSRYKLKISLKLDPAQQHVAIIIKSSFLLVISQWHCTKIFTIIHKAENKYKVNKCF